MDLIDEIPKPPDDANVPPVTQKITTTKGSWMNYFVYLLLIAIVVLGVIVRNISTQKDGETKAQLDQKDKIIEQKQNEIRQNNIDCNLMQSYWIRKYDSVSAILFSFQSSRIQMDQPSTKTIIIKSRKK